MKVYTVSEINREIRSLLAEHVVTVQGEVSNFHVTRNQLVFFELKDAQAYVTCFLMAFQMEEPLSDGMEVRVIANPSLFLKSGSYHLAVRRIEQLGAGDLQQQLRKLKQKLEAEGLFAEERKRAIPAFPENIGVITSEDGAAITDVLRVLKNRWPLASVQMLPVGVQGAAAIPGIVRALEWVNDHADEFDTVILTRGGGSLEDLQAFNSEEICRAVFSCRVPVIAGVGHERDETLVEFVADRRAATPSNAAELATPNREDVAYYIRTQEERMIAGLRHAASDRKEAFRDAVDRLELAVQAPFQRVENQLQKFAISARQFEHAVTASYDHVQSLTKLLHSLSPEHVLQRGYSITRDAQGHTIRTIAQVSPGDALTTVLSEGQLSSVVTNTYAKKRKNVS